MRRACARVPGMPRAQFTRAMQYNMQMPARAGDAHRGRFFEILENCFKQAAEIPDGGSVFDTLEPRPIWVKIAPQPCTDAGGTRLAYYGQQSLLQYDDDGNRLPEKRTEDRVRAGCWACWGGLGGAEGGPSQGMLLKRGRAGTARGRLFPPASSSREWISVPPTVVL